MTELTYLFALVAVLAGLVASISIWAPRRLWIKLCALATAALFLPAAYIALMQLLSMPKPVSYEWWHGQADEATVLSSNLQEQRGIYLWLQLPDVPEPRAYVLPWDQKMAEQLQAAQREAEERRSGVQMRLPFERSLDDRKPKFYAMPQPALPPKDGDHPPAQVYERAPKQEV
ncbi:MAG: hypothetical protein AAF637_00675 [Pseudomonadota bacterium]